ncbi:MAG: radical SAM protein [Planctomycetota bacterium]
MHDVLQNLVHALASERSTYHAFEYRARRMVYDLATGSLLEPGPGAFELLRGIEERVEPHVLLERVQAAEPGCEIEALAGEIETLRDFGFFRLEPLESPEEREQTIEAHLETHPRSHQILVQTSCNLKCTYCYEVDAGFHGTGKSMKSATGRRSIDLFLERAGPRKQLDITFFGGEPLLNFELVRELVDYARERARALDKEITFKLTTNGVLLDDEIIAYLVENRFAVMISLDGEPEKNDLMRKDHAGRGTGEKVLEHARKLVAAQRAAGVREACVRSTMTVGNHSALEISAFLARAGFKRVMIGSSNGRAHEKREWDLGSERGLAFEDEMRAEGEQVLDAFLAGLRGTGAPLPDGIDPRKALEHMHESLTTARSHRRHVTCGVGRNMTAITEKGDIYPCHRYVGEEAWKIGHLTTGVDREKLGQYYRQIFSGYDAHCSSCWARNICGGQCPWYLSRADGVVGTPDEPSCDAIREGAERTLWLYNQVREMGHSFAGASARTPDDAYGPEADDS